ncbi:MAG: methylenetetrahydrofolate--tRNA-(uracil(54)-C(5))-methyltransferase (FADH(2)-oxidizing) TrmFO [Desulfovibrionaceae bacterium]|nr:methylenetetrahydrofolate--tRNA-(uracil(54)-C(5))-methyltransferase (FADH(2)-oxidizing) TrmFO [Desulfovibrionaceae bacterium]
MEKKVAIIGAGLAGCECALILARAGLHVVLFEQKPHYHSEAHVSNLFAELVCSNSLRSNELTSGIGLLKQELRDLQSPFMAAADAHAVPADKALAVDRVAFATSLTHAVQQHPLIEVVCAKVTSLSDPRLTSSDIAYVVVAAGPVADNELVADLVRNLGQEACYFYDAIAPIVWTNSLDFQIVFWGSRYQDEEGEIGDYLNCPMTKEEYTRFYEALCAAKTVPARQFEQLKHFEGCMPIEALASRGFKTLAFGPFKPVGFVDPRTHQRPYAIVQLRSENVQQETCNLVGCQTRMLQAEQQRVFRLIPGLANCEFARYGSMHRNTYVNAPLVLDASLALKSTPRVLLAGQITGVEGYVESAACGLWVGQVLAARLLGYTLSQPPKETALGALLGYLQVVQKKFQPSNAHFGLMPALDTKLKKIDRKKAYSERARSAFKTWQQNQRLV